MEKGPQLNQSFAKPSISEWIAKINKDLKGAKTADELNYKIEEGLSISALQAYSATDLNPISRNDDHIVACHVNTQETACNASIKNLLNAGVNTLILDAYRDVDYDQVLDGIILDFIKVVIYPMDEGAEDKVMNYLVKQNADLKKVYSPNSSRNLIHIPFTDSISEQLCELLLKVSENKNDELLLVVDAQKNFLSEVSKVRAAHILLANLEVALDKKLNYRLLSHTKANKEGVHELIQSSYMTLAAIIGQADGIVSVALDPKYKINAIHIYNLLTMESYLGKVNDPASGSNLIEEMTEVICQKSWRQFVEKV